MISLIEDDILACDDPIEGRRSVQGNGHGRSMTPKFGIGGIDYNPPDVHVVGEGKNCE